VAIQDGFKNEREMREWFNKKHNLPNPETLFQVIRW